MKKVLLFLVISITSLSTYANQFWYGEMTDQFVKFSGKGNLSGISLEYACKMVEEVKYQKYFTPEERLSIANIDYISNPDDHNFRIRLKLDLTGLNRPDYTDDPIIVNSAIAKQSLKLFDYSGRYVKEVDLRTLIPLLIKYAKEVRDCKNKRKAELADYDAKMTDLKERGRKAQVTEEKDKIKKENITLIAVGLVVLLVLFIAFTIFRRKKSAQKSQE